MNMIIKTDKRHHQDRWTGQSVGLLKTCFEGTPEKYVAYGESHLVGVEKLLHYVMRCIKVVGVNGCWSVTSRDPRPV
jgi:hypothetical protein